MNKTHAALLVIVLLGAFLRFHDIDKQGFWLDESATALSIKKYSLSETFDNTVNLGQILPSYYSSNLDLPPYYIILKLWSGIFGLNEASLRSFSALFGILSIIIIYFLSKELFNSKTAVIASLIFSLNVVMVEYSQEARLYSMLIFIVLLASYFFIKSLKTNRNKYIAGFVISNIAGIYTHYTFLFFVAFELFFAVILFAKNYLKSKKIKIMKIYIASSSLIIFYIPLAARLVKPKLVATHYLGSFSFGILARVFLQLNTWFYPSEQLTKNINNSQIGLFLFSDWILVVSAALLTCLLLIFALMNFAGAKKIDDSRLFLLLLLLIPLVMGFATLYKSILTFGSIKYFIFVVPAYLILAANGIASLKNKKLVLFLSLIIILSIPQIYSYYSNPSKPQYRESAKFIEVNSMDNELIIVNLPSIAVPFGYYSDKLTNVHGAASAADAKKISINSKSLWLVLSTKYADPDGGIKYHFDDNYKLSGSKSFHDVRIYHYRK